MKLALAALAISSLALVGVASPAIASASPSIDKYAFEVGDDNGDGVIVEDESGWDCTTTGNMVCGPDNGVTAGQYASGVLVPWSQPIIPEWCRDICLGA